MTKEELLARLDRRSRQHYGVAFTKSFLNDLIKDKLVQRSKRLANRGKHPVHFWGRDAYRRGLQLARLKVRGIEGRNSQRVFLFLKGYGYPVYLVREPLRAEYVSYGKKLLGAVRSRHINHKQAIPAEQKARLVRSFGEPDPSFVKAGINLDSNFLISLMRSAMQDAMDLGGTFSQEILQNRHLASQAVAAAVSKMIGGLLLIGGAPGNIDHELDNVESLIMNAPENAYGKAREMLRALDFDNSLVSKMVFPNSSHDAFETAARKAKSAIEHDPLFATTAFVLLLRNAMSEIDR